MKKLFLLGLATVLFITCQKREPQRFFTASSEIDIVKALLTDYHAGDWDAWAGHYADTAKIYHNTLESATVKETIENLVNILSNVSTYKFDDGEDDRFYEMVITDENEKWVYFWGTWRGELATNNQKLIIPVHLALQFVDGKIVEEYAYFNISEFNSALQEIEAAKTAEEEAN